MADVVAAYQVEWKRSAVWVDISASVLEVPDGESALSGGGDQPLAFGDSAESRCTVKVVDELTAGDDVTGTPIRVTYSIDGAAVEAFVGVIQGQQESVGDATVELTCTGVAELVRVKKSYSPAFYLRPAATKTTVVSIEDYTDPGYAGGLMNYALWRAGGRPYEQAITYPGAAFYYSLDQAILSPTWSWLAGEDGWSELQKLAQAAGGQLYQDTLGVVRYKQPLNIVANAPTFTFDESVYANATRSRRRGQLATKVLISYIPRQARPLQEVLDDDTPRLIHDGETIEFALEPQWPLKSLEINSGTMDIKDMDGSENLGPQALKITDLTGQTIAQGVDGYGHQLTAAAQQITLAITNVASRPIVLWHVILRGEPITAGEGGIVSVGTGEEERQVSDNPYIQSRGHAERLANLILTFYGSARAAIEVEGCVYDPAREVGEVVNFTASRWGVSSVPHVIVKAAHDETGAGASYTLAPVAGLPSALDYYTIGTFNYTGLSRAVAY